MNELTESFNFKDILNLVFALGVAWATLKAGLKEVFTYARNVNDKLMNHIEETAKAFQQLKEDYRKLKESQSEFKKDIENRFRPLEAKLTEVHTYVKVLYEERNK